MTQRKQGQFKNDNLQSSGGYSKRNKPEHIEMKVKYSRFRHNAKQTRFTLPTGPRRQGDPFFSKSKKKNPDSPVKEASTLTYKHTILFS